MNNTTRVVLPIIVLLLGAAGAAGLVLTRSKPKRAAPDRLPPLVELVQVTPAKEHTRVSAMGTIVAAEEVQLMAEIAGRLTWVSPELVPGGRVTKGQVIARIDPKEHQLSVEQQTAAVERAQFELAMEQGRRRIAEREWKLIGEEGTASPEGRALALREPHIKSAEAAVASAQSVLDRAKLNVERTVIRAPFAAFVKDEQVDEGQLVGPQSRLASLVGTDRFWVQVSVPVAQLRWIAVPGVNAKAGAEVKVFQDLGDLEAIERHGRVARLMGDLDPKGRMARVLVEVEDPLGLKLPEGNDRMPLLLGAYVRVEIEGHALEDVYAIPRLAVRDGSKAWIAGADDRLLIRELEIAWRGKQQVYVSNGLAPGDRVILSRLAMPVEGMPLRTSDERAPNRPVVRASEDAAGSGAAAAAR